MKKKHKPKPNFLIIGAAKAGATSLAHALAAHPDVGFALGMQPNFFSFDEKFQLGWKKYLRLFEHCVGKDAVGDASRSYSRIRYSPQVVDRIHEHIPKAKLVYMVRHPLDRMVSAYVEHMSYPNPPSFTSVNDAVRREPMIVDSSRYGEVYRAYRARFPEDQIKVLWYEEFLNNPISVYQETCRFLGVDDSFRPDFSNEHATPTRDADEALRTNTPAGLPLNSAWDEETRRWVMDQIGADIREFLNSLGKPLTLWPDLELEHGPSH